VTDATEPSGHAYFIITVTCVECGVTLEVPESRAGDPRPITCGGCPTIEPIEQREQEGSA
jgi:hypothetical protein